MYYLVISVLSVNLSISFDVVTENKFESLENCLNKKEYFLTNDNLVYSEMCAHEDDLKFLNYDMQSDQFSKNIFHYKNN